MRPITANPNRTLALPIIYPRPHTDQTLWVGDTYVVNTSQCAVKKHFNFKPVAATVISLEVRNSIQMLLKAVISLAGQNRDMSHGGRFVGG